MTLDPIAVERLRAALRDVRSAIDAVERDWTHEVEITAVTKAHPPDVIECAVACGLRSIGENYAQELLAKRATIEAIAVSDRPRVDFIGRLQSNKVRQIAGIVDRWATVDRIALIDEIARCDPGGHVLVQVNTTREDQKGGCDPDQVSALVARCRHMGLEVDGLMAVGPTAGQPDDARDGFRRVRQLVDDLGLSVCSMGMTGDLAQAIESGATNVRIGSALFGERSPVKPPAQPPVHTPVHPEGDRRG